MDAFTAQHFGVVRVEALGAVHLWVGQKLIRDRSLGLLAALLLVGGGVLFETWGVQDVLGCDDLLAIGRFARLGFVFHIA